jgi:hypothetical protein
LRRSDAPCAIDLPMRPNHANAIPRRQPPGEVLFMIPQVIIHNNLSKVTLNGVNIFKRQYVVDVLSCRQENKETLRCCHTQGIGHAGETA